MVVNVKSIVGERLNPYMHEVQEVWTSIGYDDTEQQSKCESLSQQLLQILYETLRQENECRVRLDREIDEKRRELNDWSHATGKPSFFPPRDLSSYQLLKLLNEKVNEFKIEAQNRKREFHSAFRQIHFYVRQLGIQSNPESIIPTWNHIHSTRQRYSDKSSSPTDSVAAVNVTIPPEAELQKVRDALNILREKHSMQWKHFSSLRDDLRRISQDVQYMTQNNFEEIVLRAESPKLELEANGAADAELTLVDLEEENTSNSCEKGSTSKDATPSLLAVESIKAMEEWRQRLVKQKAMLMGSCEELRSHLKVMWARLGVPEEYQKHFLSKHSGYKPSDLEALQEEQDRCQQLKWEHLNDYVSGMQKELSYYCSLCMTEAPTPSGGSLRDSYSQEQELTHLEKAVEQMRAQYEQQKPMYDIVAQYQRLWEQYLQIENKMKDPAILSNRGGILLKTEKEKKRLLKELPRMEQEVQSQLDHLLSSSRCGTSFTLREGLTFSEYVHHLWKEFNKDRDTSKFRRSRGSTSLLGPGSAQSLNSSSEGMRDIGQAEIGNSPNLKRSSNLIPSDTVASSPRRTSYTKSS